MFLIAGASASLGILVFWPAACKALQAFRWRAVIKALTKDDYPQVIG